MATMIYFPKSIVSAAFIALSFMTTTLQAAEQRVLATVYDRPVTSRDVDYHISLLKFLGRKNVSRQAALEAVINQIVKVETAKAERMEVKQSDLDERLSTVSKALKTDRKGLAAKLRSQGISMRTMEQYLASQVAFARLLRFKYKAEYKVDQAAIDRKYEALKQDIRANIDGQVAKIMADPRMKPVTVYSLLEIKFPIDAQSGLPEDQLLQSRAAEAIQYSQRFKSCKNPRGPASGIFNVQVGKKIEADASKLPPQLRKLLTSKGPNNAYGPMRAGNALQLVAFCGQRTITPPKPKFEYKYPPKEAIAGSVEAEGFDQFEKKYVADMRKNVIIEYKTAQAEQ